MHRKGLFLFILITIILAACGGQEPAAEPQLSEITRVVTDVQEVEVTRVVTEQEEVEVTRVVESQQDILALPSVDPLEVEGDIVTAGSSTV
ncbi:MAG: hypothetical protein ACOC9Z_08190, partial [Chloroflexota bacterium]